MKTLKLPIPKLDINKFPKPDESYWDAVRQEHPIGMKIFDRWMDEYKKANDWDALFRNPIGARPTVSNDPVIDIGLEQRRRDWDRGKVKYHDLPLAMQAGIVLEFFAEYNKNYNFYWKSDVLKIDWKDEMRKMIASVQMLEEIKAKAQG